MSIKYKKIIFLAYFHLSLQTQSILCPQKRYWHHGRRKTSGRFTGWKGRKTTI